MTDHVEYSGWERAWLIALAVVGATAVNGTFLYGLVVDRQMLATAMANPMSAVFIVEALLLTVALGYLLVKWRVARLGWGWFVTLSLLGSMAFALPLVLLWPRRDR